MVSIGFAKFQLGLLSQPVRERARLWFVVRPWSRPRHGFGGYDNKETILCTIDHHNA